MAQADDPIDLKARARRAFERTMDDDEAQTVRSVDPDTLATLERAVRSLRRLDRDIFLAVRLDAMSYETIAKRTGLTVGQVERRLARALREIGAYMRDQPVRRHRWWSFGLAGWAFAGLLFTLTRC